MREPRIIALPDVIALPNDEHVAVAPGSAFGELGEGYV